MGFMNSFNEKFNASAAGKYFQLEKRGSNFTTELRGATATFLTMAYILVSIIIPMAFLILPPMLKGEWRVLSNESYAFVSFTGGESCNLGR